MSVTTVEVKHDDVVVDALPYIDSEYDEPGVKEMVVAQIEEEKKRYRPTKNYLEHLAPLELNKFETELMKKEYERLSQRAPMEVMSMKRYELPPPPTGKLTDLSAWNECVDNSFAQLEHQATRICNLELMTEYSCESWKMYLDVMVRMVSKAQKKLAEVKKQIQEVNWERKSNQNDVGENLRILEGSWVGLVSKNYEIERALIELEKKKYEFDAAIARDKAMSVDSLPMEEELRATPTYSEYYKNPENFSDTSENTTDQTDSKNFSNEPGKASSNPQPINFEPLSSNEDEGDREKYDAQAEMDAAESSGDDDDD